MLTPTILRRYAARPDCCASPTVEQLYHLAADVAGATPGQEVHTDPVAHPYLLVGSRSDWLDVPQRQLADAAYVSG
ncbi:hypothetical protein GPECTOR_12g433 [Gonium pectorale]|uniref:Uncharacterized protein n=1 Tax=Gonium pectorale TaxID=33097 RepID=A0A150GQ53_GONPE|nr:hypothetical protein GPECTOR_12g433 [Gonium pectorale]|eukprot:KXZ51470.1 hypothetical protein GPECTOR_12g433 [Gonium pectorale]